MNSWLGSLLWELRQSKAMIPKYKQVLPLQLFLHTGAVCQIGRLR